MKRKQLFFGVNCVVLCLVLLAGVSKIEAEKNSKSSILDKTSKKKKFAYVPSDEKEPIETRLKVLKEIFQTQKESLEVLKEMRDILKEQNEMLKGQN